MKKISKKTVITAAAGITVLAVLFFCVFAPKDSLKSAFENAGLTVLEIKKDEPFTEITIAAGTDGIDEENIIIARYAKEILQNLSEESVKVKLQTGNKNIIAELSRTETADSAFLPLYMEESLLKFKIRCGLERTGIRLSGLKVTAYPQCYLSGKNPESDERTVNVSVISSTENLNTDRSKIESLFTFLNENGAAVRIYNVSYADSDGNILLLTSKDSTCNDEIVIENHDTDK